MNEEIWKPVLGYEGKYEVSSEGRVRSLIAKNAPLIMRQNLRKDGYLQVQLKVNQQPKNRLVHTLVDEAFNGNRQPDREVNHIDGDKKNNRLSNLERLNRKENVRHAFKAGLCGSRRGERNPGCTIPDSTIIAIRSEPVEFSNGRFPHGSLTKISEKYGVSRSYVRKILTGENRGEE